MKVKLNCKPELEPALVGFYTFFSLTGMGVLASELDLPLIQGKPEFAISFDAFDIVNRYSMV